MLDTWMNQTKAKVYIFSETPSTSLPIIVLPDLEDSFQANTPKFWKALRYTWQHEGLRPRWYVKIDDDTFLNTKYLVEVVNANTQIRWQNRTVFGRGDSYDFAPGLRAPFIDGGSG